MIEPSVPAGPAPGLALDDAEDDGEQSECQEYDAGRVELLACRCLVLGLGEYQDAEDEGDDADGGVDVEDRLPVDVLDEESADDRAECGGDGGDHCPDPDRHAELLRREHGAQQGEGVGHEHRAEEALYGAEGDDALDRADETDGDGREGESGDADEIEGAAAEAVTELAAEDERRGEGEQVGVGDPLQFGSGGTQVAGDFGVGD